MKRWTKEQTDYLINNYYKMHYEDMSKVICKSANAIRAKCFDLGLVKNSRWTEDEMSFLINHLNDMTYKEIAKALNRTESSVKTKAEKNGIKKRPYYCEYDFFKTIDSEEKAYWLGFLCADGWITENIKTNSGHVGIQLQIRDYEHLKKFNKSIHGNYKIEIGEKECKLSNPNKKNKFCRIRIHSINMVNHLKKHGFTNAKTYDLKFPNIQKNLYRHFIRGFFDGDGCVRMRNRKLVSGTNKTYPQCDITSNVESFLCELRTLLYDVGITSYICKDRNNFRLYISGLKSNMLFLNYIYENSNCYLDRKYQIYTNILQNVDCLAN